MRFLKLIFLSLLLSGCATTSHNQPIEKIATQAHLQPILLDVGQFILTTYSRINDPTLPLHIYIEGDGLAWRTRYEASLNPTPKHALALQLAAQDSHANVVYIARPCQFTKPALKVCDQAYWTNKRFAPEVINSTNLAISHFASRLYQPKLDKPAIILVGYSGGAAVAALAAIQRQDIIGLVTVAGNLDIEAVNRHHQVSAMLNSLNPVDYLAQIARIPQLHWVGEKDLRVPPHITEQFVEAQANNRAKVIRIASASHESGWLEEWPTLLPMLKTFTN